MIRIVAITVDTPYTLADDEVILEKRASYGDVVVWHLLIQKGGSALASGGASFTVSREQSEQDTRRAARHERMVAAFAEALVAFGAGLAEPSES